MEWEKVRKESDPILRPEDKPIDRRPLWQQIADRTEAEKIEREEAKKFKNQIWQGVDNAEAEFFIQVAESEANLEYIREKEQKEAMEDSKRARQKLMKQEME